MNKKIVITFEYLDRPDIKIPIIVDKADIPLDYNWTKFFNHFLESLREKINDNE